MLMQLFVKASHSRWASWPEIAFQTDNIKLSQTAVQHLVLAKLATVVEEICTIFVHGLKFRIIPDHTAPQKFGEMLPPQFLLITSLHVEHKWPNYTGVSIIGTCKISENFVKKNLARNAQLWSKYIAVIPNCPDFCILGVPMPHQFNGQGERWQGDDILIPAKLQPWLLQHVIPMVQNILKSNHWVT